MPDSICCMPGSRLVFRYGCGVAVVMFSGPLASMKQVIADKSTASLPFGMTVATVITASLWTVFGKAVLDDVCKELLCTHVCFGGGMYHH